MAQSNQRPSVSLMDFLQQGLPSLEWVYTGQSTTNTTNDVYSAQDIKSIGQWNDFNIDTIREKFGDILSNATIPENPTIVNPESPVPKFGSEDELKEHIVTFIKSRLNAAIRCGVGFNNRRSTTNDLPLTLVRYGSGWSAKTVEGYRPDIAYFDPDDNAESRPNRVPAEIKLSHKWSPDMSRNPSKEREFRKPLSQVNFYMKQHHSRYSFILTDECLVGIRRIDEKGKLELSRAIPWNASGTADRPVVTVLLAMWYFAMLAANDDQDGWYLEKPKPAKRTDTHRKVTTGEGFTPHPMETRSSRNPGGSSSNQGLDRHPTDTRSTRNPRGGSSGHNASQGSNRQSMEARGNQNPRSGPSSHNSSQPPKHKPKKR